MFFFQSFLDDSWETLCSVTEKSIPREDAYFTRLGSVRNSIDPFLFIVEMRFTSRNRDRKITSDTTNNRVISFFDF